VAEQRVVTRSVTRMSIVHETLSYLLTNLKTYEQILAVSYMQNKYAIYF